MYNYSRYNTYTPLCSSNITWTRHLYSRDHHMRSAGTLHRVIEMRHSRGHGWWWFSIMGNSRPLLPRMGIPLSFRLRPRLRGLLGGCVGGFTVVAHSQNIHRYILITYSMYIYYCRSGRFSIHSCHSLLVGVHMTTSHTAVFLY